MTASGYPHGTAGSEISLDVRILTVCDVYDALISTRVYREAWAPRAGDCPAEERDRHRLHAKCVAALERVLARERGPILVAV